jgi:GNAT superfamily N-acetyltransferase
MPWTIRKFDPRSEPTLLDAVTALRLNCWAAMSPVPLTLDDVVDNHEAMARHWIAVADNEVIGAARLTIHDVLDAIPEAVCLSGVFAEHPPAPIGFLSRLVVAPACRRRGVGRGLDEARIGAALAEGCRTLLALVFDVSGEARAAQLVSHGFVIRGRGRQDTHPKFSILPAPLILERVISSH